MVHCCKTYHPPTNHSINYIKKTIKILIRFSYLSDVTKIDVRITKAIIKRKNKEEEVISPDIKCLSAFIFSNHRGW
jgi:hypothetical protein